MHCQSKADKGGESALRSALAVGNLMEEEDNERKEDVYLRLELVLLTLKIPYLWYK